MFWWAGEPKSPFQATNVFGRADGEGRQTGEKTENPGAENDAAGFSRPDLRLLEEEEEAAMVEGVASFVWVDLPLRIKFPDRRKVFLPLLSIVMKS